MSMVKMAEIIEQHLLKGSSPGSIATNISTASGIPIVVLYYWFYKNKGVLAEDIIRVSDFYGYTEILDGSENILLTLKQG